MSLSKVSLFDFKGHPVQVVLRGGDPWFVGSDVCKILGYRKNAKGYVNVTDALRPLDNSERCIDRIDTSRRSVALIAESGLYKVVLRSDKPDAKEFQNWVTQVVLPSIRKDGGYVMGEEKLATGEMTEDQFILTAMRMMEDKVARYRATICHQVTV